jgi:ADP-L-glycero-D-manno-heptose 6-epimerase
MHSPDEACAKKAETVLCLSSVILLCVRNGNVSKGASMFLITGGAGFIGSNLAAALEKRGPESGLVICDRLGSENKWRNVSRRALEAIVPPEDLTSWLDAYAGEIETVFHLGAISSTTERNADFVIENNFTLSCYLWDWCQAHETRFIYASSGATYGDGSAGFLDDDSPEHMARLNPLNPYGWSKHLFDRWVSRRLIAYGPEAAPPQWAGLKFFNVYGPNEYHKGEQMSVVCKRFPDAASGKGVKLFKSNHPEFPDGGQMRDFIHVNDCVDVMLWLQDNAQVNGLFNVGTGKARSFKDMMMALFAAVGQQPNIEYIDMPPELQGKYQNYTQADMQKLRVAGYANAFIELEDGVRRYAQNFLMKDDPYV